MLRYQAEKAKLQIHRLRLTLQQAEEELQAIIRDLDRTEPQTDARQNLGERLTV